MIKTPSAILIAVFCLALAPASFAEESETIRFDKLSHTQRTTISTAGAAAIKSITEARVSLDRKDGPGARRALGAAAEQLRTVRNASPSASLGDGVDSLHAQLVKGEGGNPASLTPIFTQLDAYQEIAGVGAATEVRAHLEGAKGKLASGEDEEAAVLLEEASQSIRYMEIDLPVKQTLASVDRARNQVGQNDFMGADANLRESLGSIQTFGEMASIQTDEEIEDVGMGPE